MNAAPKPKNPLRATFAGNFKKDTVRRNESIPNNSDHIILTKTFVSERKINIETWNTDKKLSDHIGVSITLS